MKIIVLASGGIDSSLIMYLFQKEGYQVLPLYINYGQLAEKKEWEALIRVCNHLKLQPFKMDITGFGKLPSGLTNPSLDIYNDAFLPTRNLTFVTLGSAYAYSVDSNLIAIGLLSNPIFPDQSKEFIEKAQISISTSLGREMKILTPFIDLDKRDILRLAKKHNLPSVTYYCHSGSEIPCGVCISCRERIAAEDSLNNQ
jgi:7-cyano-7-deazaguanine synthase